MHQCAGIHKILTDVHVYWRHVFPNLLIQQPLVRSSTGCRHHVQSQYRLLRDTYSPSGFIVRLGQCNLTITGSRLHHLTGVADKGPFNHEWVPTHSSGVSTWCNFELLIPKYALERFRGICGFNIGLVFFHDLQNVRTHLLVNGMSHLVHSDLQFSS